MIDCRFRGLGIEGKHSRLMRWHLIYGVSGYRSCIGCENRHKLSASSLDGYPVGGGTETLCGFLTFRRCQQPTKRCISSSTPGRIASQPQHIFPPKLTVSRRSQHVVDIPHMIDTPNSWVVASALQLCPGYRPDHWIRCSPRRVSLTASLWSP